MLWVWKVGFGWFCQSKGCEGSRDLPMDLFSLTECKLQRSQSRSRWAAPYTLQSPIFVPKKLIFGPVPEESPGTPAQTSWESKVCWRSASNSPEIRAGLLPSPWQWPGITTSSALLSSGILQLVTQQTSGLDAKFTTGRGDVASPLSLVHLWNCSSSEFNLESIRSGTKNPKLTVVCTCTLQSKVAFYSSKIGFPSSPLKYITPKLYWCSRIEMKSRQE